MTVTANWEKQEGNEGTLTITVSADQFDDALDHAFKKVVKDVSLPGFRKGKIPRPIFEKRFGVESLYQDAVDYVLSPAYSEAMDQTGMLTVSHAYLDSYEIEKSKAHMFKWKVTEKPEMKSREYKGLEGEDETATSTHEDVEEEMKRIQESQAELVLKEEGSI